PILGISGRVFCLAQRSAAGKQEGCGRRFRPFTFNASERQEVGTVLFVFPRLSHPARGSKEAKAIIADSIMTQMQGFGRKYIKAFLKGFFVAVPVTVTFLDRVACIARVEGTSMQPSLNPMEQQVSDIVLLNHWSVRNYE
ncbi:Mitochondrial inner membrane protease subunit 2, partial [Ophiophagus hannah]